MLDYDLIVVGAGPSGYVAAIRAAQLGMKVVILEKNEIGGVCLNWGCIPTKALLQNARVLDVVNNANKFGIEISDVKINWEKMIKRSRDVVKRPSKGIEYLMKKNHVDYIFPSFDYDFQLQYSNLNLFSYILHDFPYHLNLHSHLLV